jgi:beta-lactamase class A
MHHPSSPPTRGMSNRWLISVAVMLAGLAIGSLACAHPNGSSVPAGAPTASIKLHLQQIIQGKLKAHEADHVSIYFRDLGSDSGFGIGEDYKFTPASLMKVPVMIAYLKRAEADPAYLQRKILCAGGLDHNATQGFKPLLALHKGQTYTIDELIHRMIAFSDNNALALLLQNIDQDALFKVLKDLHVDYVPTADGGQVSLKNYANFFQALYHNSYLGPQMSAYALHYLAQEEFKGGISAGVPQGTTVAAKFGEWALGSHSELRTLQEVGIVYFRGHPYLLGVETEGPQIDKLSSVIREISHEIYAQVRTDNSHRKS